MIPFNVTTACLMIPRNHVARITNLIASNLDKNTFQISTQKDYNFPDKFSFCGGAHSWDYNEYLVYKKVSATVKKNKEYVLLPFSDHLTLRNLRTPAVSIINQQMPISFPTTDYYRIKSLLIIVLNQRKCMIN